MHLAFRLLPGSGVQHNAEEALAHLLDRGDAVDNLPAVNVDVLFLPVPQGSVGRELERGRRSAAVGRATSRGEADHVSAARDLAGRGDWVVARRVHVDESAG